MERSHKYSKKLKKGVILAFLTTLLVFTGTNWTFEASAALVDELREKIEGKNKEIEKINKEIGRYQKELEEVGREADTLKGAIRSLDITHDKLLQDIRLTENKVDSTNLNLDRLALEIIESENKIDTNSEALSETLRLLNEAGESSLVETFLKYDDISSFWNEVGTLENFQIGVKQNLANLKVVKEVLEGQKDETERRRDELETLRSDLDSQENIVEVNKNQKQSLLSQTKNKESEYKKILDRNLARKAEFEKELFEFESQLKIAIDPSLIPSAQSGILSWPLDSIFITQLFGRTVDAKRLYVSGTHNGVDFRSAMGTPVRSATDGVVSHVGNTDNVNGCYSFGKWILVKHNNGLSTLYSHLSTIKVSPGQQVKRGGVIAFSGGLPGTPGAGYSTGPHLHFGVYATQGLRPQNYQSSTPCNGAFMPLADRKAYLDPIDYLPPI
jgi:murein DD-endopeptidase MepM/ murein hydrolase activator NlpD